MEQVLDRTGARTGARHICAARTGARHICAEKNRVTPLRQKIRVTSLRYLLRQHLLRHLLRVIHDLLGYLSNASGTLFGADPVSTLFGVIRRADPSEGLAANVEQVLL